LIQDSILNENLRELQEDTQLSLQRKVSLELQLMFPDQIWEQISRQ